MKIVLVRTKKLINHSVASAQIAQGMWYAKICRLLALD